MFNFLSNMNTGFNWFNNYSFNSFYNNMGNWFSPVSYFNNFSTSLFSYTPSTLFPSFTNTRTTTSPTFTSSFHSSYTPNLFSSSTSQKSSFWSSGFNTVKNYFTSGAKSVYNTAVRTYNNIKGKVLGRKGSQYGKPFLDKVKQIANRLHCDYRDLLGLMNNESGIRADAKCKTSSATGLIQFIESTARSLGTTTAQLRAMSPIKQLDYVEAYLSRCIKRYGLSNKSHISAGDLYAIVFLPGRAKNEVLTRRGEKYYAQNRGLDVNKDGVITKSDLAQKIRSKYVSDQSFIA